MAKLKFRYRSVDGVNKFVWYTEAEAREELKYHDLGASYAASFDGVSTLTPANGPARALFNTLLHPDPQNDATEATKTTNAGMNLPSYKACKSDDPRFWDDPPNTTGLHPHLEEELRYRDAPHPNSSEYGRQEAAMGAGWNGEEWNRDRPWLLTMFDEWIPNPHYYGPPGAPHPEEYDGSPEADAELDTWDAFHDAWWAAEKAGKPHPELTVYAPAAPVESVAEDDIPF